EEGGPGAAKRRGGAAKSAGRGKAPLPIKPPRIAAASLDRTRGAAHVEWRSDAWNEVRMTGAATEERPALKVLLCSPRGFCAGVVRAIDTVEQALARYGAPVYVRHEIVHNRYVVESLKAKGAIFVEELDEIPDTDAPVIFSAHGV